MNYLNILQNELNRLLDAKMFKHEVPLEGEQGGTVMVNGKDVVMLASNNYIGLANHPKIKEAAIEGINKYGYGVSSVRFICGTQTIHLKLEQKISSFLGTEDTILFLSCFSANEGFFAPIFNEPLGYEAHKDIVFSDALNHASIIDGMRLCSKKYTDKKIYKHADVSDLERLLEENTGEDHRFRVIATDGVFSMEGDLAPLTGLVALSEKYNAILMVDDSHAIGVIGDTGRGTPEELGVHGRIDVLTGTLGKAMGGAVGGYISGKKSLVGYLRQKSRPYTFSNSLPPPVVYTALKAFDLLENDNSLIEKLKKNTAYFRKEIGALGFTIIDGIHPIVPIMLGEAAVAMDMSEALLKAGVYIKGLWFPVVPKGEARLRTQISAAHSTDDLDRALEAFEKIGKQMEVI